jgi:hypothetical protein
MRGIDKEDLVRVEDTYEETFETKDVAGQRFLTLN